MSEKISEFKTHLFREMPAADVYRLMIGAVVPRPIAWVSTCDETGRPNLAPFSYFSAISSDPPMVSIAITYVKDRATGAIRKKDTLLNIEKTGELVIHIAGEDQAEALNQTSGEYPYGVSEFEKVGLTPVRSSVVRPPRVREAAIQMECRLYELLPIGQPSVGASTLVIAQVLAMHVAAEFEGRLEEFRPLSRLGGTRFGKTREVFSIERPRLNDRLNDRNE